VTRIAFLGTPSAAIPTLEILASEVVIVVTRPDTAGGRSRHLRPPPVKSAAETLDLPVAQPEGRRELRATIEDADIDVAVVVAYGRLIPEQVLDLVPHGFVNVHFSLLPRWRGAAPVERAILAGDEEIGVTIIRLDAGLDTGPVIGSTSVPIGPEADAASLTRLLATLGAELTGKLLPPYVAGTIRPVPQSEEDATYADRFDSSETRLDVIGDGRALDRVIRASTSRGGAYALHRDARLKIWRARPIDILLEPGELRYEDGRVFVGAGRGGLELLEVQPAGSTRMSAAAWARGHDLGVLT
jgi:methionyl-tRNA formyltransferase